MSALAISKPFLERTCVVIADDQAPIRQRLRRLVSGMCETVAEAANGDEAMEAVRRCKPKLLLLDVSMPGKNGFEVLQHVREEYPNVLVILVTEHHEPFYVREAFARGAHGFVSKRAITNGLVECIRSVLDGERHGFSSSL